MTRSETRGRKGRGVCETMIPEILVIKVAFSGGHCTTKILVLTGTSMVAF